MGQRISLKALQRIQVKVNIKVRPVQMDPMQKPDIMDPDHSSILEPGEILI
jgi:hypothetical protein